ncbi:MAG TPA: DUF2259 domain-containing protein [Devosia sp.]|nr:DUF2259 domain-containing protein [Devosia sp.]
MKPNAALVVSARRAASVFGLFALMASPALAGDRALIDFIGFSPDARYFAFEEFGVQDGSGFAYSNIFVVDLENDTWLDGTPIRMRSEDENRPLLQVRSEANSQAIKIVADKEIFVPAEIAVLIGDGAVDADAQTLAFGLPGYERGTVRDERQLTLKTFPLKSSEDCDLWFDTPSQGFELTLAGGAASAVVHRDETLPKSRGCVLDYRLYGVVIPGLGAPQGTGVAIISYYPGGFEGPDRRFLAVPLVF